MILDIKHQSQEGQVGDSYSVFYRLSFLLFFLIQEEFLQGKRERRFEDLEGFELHCAFWGWSYKNIPQTKIDLDTFTIRELKVEDGEPVVLLGCFQINV